MKHEVYADLAIPVAVDKLFTYRVPEELGSIVKRGMRAIVPFGKRSVVGIIVDIHSRKPPISLIKSVRDLLDARPIIPEELLSLTRWISDYYIASWGEVLKAALATGALSAPKRTARLVAAVEGASNGIASGGSKRNSILTALHSGRPVSIRSLEKTTGVKGIHAILNSLASEGTVVLEDERPSQGPSPKREKTVVLSQELKPVWREWLRSQGGKPGSSQQRVALGKLAEMDVHEISVAEFLKASGVSLSTLNTLERKHLLHFGSRNVLRRAAPTSLEPPPPSEHIVANAHQRVALERITGALRGGSFQSFLLHGVTGSGKTQVYIEAIREALALGKTAIVLVPEISLTPQIVERFKRSFGDLVTVFHSRLSAGERYEAWSLAREGKYSIVIGPRSAVFAPLRNIGLIVVDEEHEASYKQFDQTPRYHARDVAIVRAHRLGAVVVLGSATPALESYANAIHGKYTLIELPERVDNARLPRIEIVDMTVERQKKLSMFREQRKAEFKQNPVLARLSKRKFELELISDLLRQHIGERLEKKEGIIILQNRRGFAPVVECPDCGYVEMCDNCNITLTYHITKHHLRCHYCGRVKQPPDACPQCQGIDIRYRGFGTQRVEEDLRRLFPDARLLRMDLDTTSRRGSHERILHAFAQGEADILLGTQMVAKGLDFSRVTLVGVISADTQMLLPDYRSAERTFQLLTQVAGRAGRSHLAGEVIIQTFQPSHYSLRHVVNHDFKSFYVEELSYRKELLYPPYSRIVLIEFRGEEETEVIRHAKMLATTLQRHAGGYLLLGPAPAAITKINKQFRWHIVVKDLKGTHPSARTIHRALKEVLGEDSVSAAGRRKKVQCSIDVDPAGMM